MSSMKGQSPSSRISVLVTVFMLGRWFVADSLSYKIQTLWPLFCPETSFPDNKTECRPCDVEEAGGSVMCDKTCVSVCECSQHASAAVAFSLNTMPSVETDTGTSRR